MTNLDEFLGVFVESQDHLSDALSAVSIDTAIPAFIGYTQTGTMNGLDRKPTLISSVLEYEEKFGYHLSYAYSPTASSGTLSNPSGFYMYAAIKMYFNNGGRQCYIVSVGQHTSTINEVGTGIVTAVTSPVENDYTDPSTGGISVLDSYDDSTLIVIPDAVSLEDASYAKVYQVALDQCANLKNRFVIIDVKADNADSANDASAFRNRASVPILDNLRYGAAYYPYLITTLSYSDTTALYLNADDNNRVLRRSDQDAADYDAAVTAAANDVTAKNDSIRLPPSSTIAGVYVSTDDEKGVWTAPANIALDYVNKPAISITDLEQGELIFAPDGSGKIINPIRYFDSKAATLVWASRTLDGNSNEWKYIRISRLMSYIEKVIRNTGQALVPEFNNASTLAKWQAVWIKWQAVMNSFLNGLWAQGAIKGNTKTEAYYVKIGLGQTMTQTDILNGDMVIQVGVAALKPAEFIILEYTQKISS